MVAVGLPPKLPPGKPVIVSGAVTLVALAAAEAVEGGTDKIRAGEELLLDPAGLQLLKGAKGSASARRRATGELALVGVDLVAILTLKPEAAWPDEEGAFRLSFGGTVLDGDTLLTALERPVRQDDAIALEFASPAMPDMLKEEPSAPPPPPPAGASAAGAGAAGRPPPPPPPPGGVRGRGSAEDEQARRDRVYEEAKRDALLGRPSVVLSGAGAGSSGAPGRAVAGKARAAPAGKLGRATADAADASNVMQQNVHALHERGEKLGELGDKSQKLSDDAENFLSLAKELRKQNERPFFGLF